MTTAREQGVDRIPARTVGVEDLWRNTWFAWRSGALSQISDTYRKAASVPYAEFRKSPDATNQQVNDVLKSREIPDTEFLIGHGAQNGAMASFVLTSSNLWLYDQSRSELVRFDLAQIREIKMSGTWTGTVTVILEDGSEHSFKKLASIPKEEVLRLVIERSKTADGWQHVVGITPRNPKGDDAASTAPLPPASTEAGERFEVVMNNGQPIGFESAAALRASIVEGRTVKDLKARRVAVDAQGKRSDGPWIALEKLGISSPSLRSLYRPVWNSTVVYAGYGAIGGIILKALDTTFTMFVIDETVGFVWLAIIGSMFLSKKWPLAPAVAIFLSFKLGVKANLFFSLLSTMAVGAIFGTPVGMILGTIVGWFRKASMKKAPDASPEGWRPYQLGILLPLLFLAILIPLYIWFNTRLIEWLEAS